MGIVFAAILFFSGNASAQIKREKTHYDEPKEQRPRNLKVLDEHKEVKDGITYFVRTVQYDQGSMRVKETIIQSENPGIGTHVAINPDTIKKDSLSIVVEKSKYCLDVYYRRRKVRSYKAVFGPHPENNKIVEGDRCTPEGSFKIQRKNGNSHYDKFMLLDYPNDSAIARFNRFKENGKLPKNARMGGDVGIHGTWPGADDMIDMGVGWTDGCIALKNKDVDDLFALVDVGTKVIIRK
jgi:lipoprotein-anchoring transpeptidase ErfK/SrfK